MAIFSRAAAKCLRMLGAKKLFFKLFPPADARRGGVAPLSEADSLSAKNFLEGYDKDARSSFIRPPKDFEKEYDLDIIVPVYNAGNYLSECVNSVLGQESEYSFRAIFIDDGSTDGSGALLDELCSGRSDAIVVHQSNKGFSGARNAGLALVRSRYIAFVDSDDVLARGAVDSLLKAAFSNDADCVQGGYICFDEGGEVSACRYPDGQCGMRGNYPNYVWGKVYRSDLWRDIRFPEGYWFEDTLAYHAFIFRIKRYFTVSPVVYKYRLHGASISSTARKNYKSIDSLYSVLQCYKDVIALGCRLSQENYQDYLSQIIISSQRLTALSGGVNRAVFTLWRQFVLSMYAQFSAPEDDNLRALEYALLKDKYLLYKLAVCC